MVSPAAARMMSLGGARAFSSSTVMQRGIPSLPLKLSYLMAEVDMSSS